MYPDPPPIDLRLRAALLSALPALAALDAM